MTDDQKAELARNEQTMLMNVQEDMNNQQDKEVNLINVTLLQGKKRRNGLSDDRLYTWITVPPSQR